MALVSVLVDHRNGPGDSVVDVVFGPVRNDRRGTDGLSSEANADQVGRAQSPRYSMLLQPT